MYWIIGTRGRSITITFGLYARFFKVDKPGVEGRAWRWL